MDQPGPAVQKVPARRSAPVVVGIVAIGLIALLAWQPWEGRSVAPTDGELAVASSTPAFRPIPSFASDGPTPELPRPRPLPTPDLGPVEPAGEFAMIPSPGSALVECRYSRFRDGRSYFRGLEVQPPTVTVFNDDDGVLDIRSISWRVEIQSKELDSVFDRDWVTVARSRRQVALPATGAAAVLFPLHVEYRVPRDDGDSVLRALVIVDWHTRNLELAGRVEHAPNSYLEMGDPRGEIRPEGCTGLRLPGQAPTGARPGPDEPVYVRW